MMTDERKEIVRGAAEEFGMDGLWGEDQNAGGQGKEIGILVLLSQDLPSPFVLVGFARIFPPEVLY